MAIRVEADVEFSVEIGGERMDGVLSGSGGDLELRVSDPHLLGGTGTDLARSVAAQLAEHGIRMRITADRPLVTLGVPSTSFLQRRITGSPHIQVASFAAALRLLRLRSASAETASLAPPPTPLPLLPTLMRRPRAPRTTHDPDRGGYPRLVTAPSTHPWPGDRQPVYWLSPETTIGSSASCSIIVPGLPEVAATVQHTASDDEYRVLPAPGVYVNGVPVRKPALLRTGSRLTVGELVLTYYREEYADHGRPFGGRVGGEIGHQKPQPPREVLSR